MMYPDFDEHSASYNEDLNKGLSISGESHNYFSEKRVAFLKEYLDPHLNEIKSIIEFGCGVGNNIQFLNQYFPHTRIIGLDISEESIQMARKRYAAQTNISFKKPPDTDSLLKADLVFVNGVFHHIPSSNHLKTLELLHRMLRKGGHLCLFENNPFNLGARWIMKHIPFDRDAVMVNPYQLKRRINNLGYLNVELKFHFIFPQILKRLRFLENLFIHWPLGAQYCVLARKQ